MKQLSLKTLRILLMIYVFFFAYEWWRPLFPELVKSSASYTVPDKGVKFVYDLPQKDKKGTVTGLRNIEARYRDILQKATRMVIISETYVPETGTSTLTTLLSEKHNKDKHVAVALMTDPVSTRYGGIHSESLDELRKKGTLVIFSNVGAMPDGNLFYSSLWRPFFSWWGNSSSGGWLSDPIRKSDKKFTLRTWLIFFNMKSDESHVLLADATDGKTKKLITLFSSSDISSPRGSTGATALEVDDKIWASIAKKKAVLADISGSGLPSLDGSDVVDASGTLRVSLLDMTRMRDRISTLIEGMHQGDQLMISARFVSDRDIIADLKDAANRNVDIRVILDPNEEVMGHPLSGMPNLPVAKELISGSSGGVKIRWCAPQALPCESRMILGKTATSTFLMIGGADLTRRDIGGFNLEDEVLVESPREFTASKEALAYFEKIWGNLEGDYTIPYEERVDDTLWKSSVYRMMERTGLSYY